MLSRRSTGETFSLSEYFYNDRNGSPLLERDPWGVRATDAFGCSGIRSPPNNQRYRGPTGSHPGDYRDIAHLHPGHLAFEGHARSPMFWEYLRRSGEPLQLLDEAHRHMRLAGPERRDGHAPRTLRAFAEIDHDGRSVIDTVARLPAARTPAGW